MASRKERLEELADRARKVINDNPNFDRRSIYQALEEHIILEWGSAQQTRNDYVKSVAAMLKEELTKRDAEIEAKIPKLDSDISMLYGRPSKERAFIDLFRRLTGENDEVDERNLINELVRSGKFADEKEAKDYVLKISREGKIYERRIGFWARA